jgi:hypothetical protein
MVAIPHILLLTAEVIVNSAAVKPGKEKIVSKALEMYFKIDGRIDIRFLPIVSLNANYLTVGINTGF